MNFAMMTEPASHSGASLRTPVSRWVSVVSHLDPRYGGLSAAVPALGLRLAAEDGFATSIAAFCGPEEQFVPKGFKASQISFWPIGRKPWLPPPVGSARIADEFTATLRGADGVHIHGLWEASTAVAASAAQRLDIPYIVSAHGMLEPWALANRRLKKLVYSALVERRNLKRAACLHALTQAEARYYTAFGARSPIAVIPNGVDVPETRDAHLFLRQYPALLGKRIVLFLGRLHSKKGLDLLLASWRDLSPQNPEAALVLAGPDAEGTEARLKAYIAEHNLGASVHFLGMLRGELKWSALAAAEVFVLPSHSEGLSVSILEAMGMGLPVIVTEPCNMPEVQVHKAGWVIPVNQQALSQALLQFLANSTSTNQQIGARGAQLIASGFTWPIVARKMAELYRWVQGGPEPKSFNLIHP